MTAKFTIFFVIKAYINNLFHQDVCNLLQEYDIEKKFNSVFYEVNIDFAQNKMDKKNYNLILHPKNKVFQRFKGRGVKNFLRLEKYPKNRFIDNFKNDFKAVRGKFDQK